MSHSCPSRTHPPADTTETRLSANQRTETTAPPTVFIPTSGKPISDFGNQKRRQVSGWPPRAERSEQFWAEDVTLVREVRREITNGRAADGNYKRGQRADSGAGQRRQRRVRGEV